MKNLKDKRIEILKIDEITERYAPIATVWAHFRSMSVEETYGAGADSAWNNVYFTIMKPVDFELDTYCKVRYNNVDYTIEGLDLFEDRKGSNVRIRAKARY